MNLIIFLYEIFFTVIRKEKQIRQSFPEFKSNNIRILSLKRKNNGRLRLVKNFLNNVYTRLNQTCIDLDKDRKNSLFKKTPKNWKIEIKKVRKQTMSAIFNKTSFQDKLLAKYSLFKLPKSTILHMVDKCCESRSVPGSKELRTTIFINYRTSRSSRRLG